LYSRKPIFWDFTLLLWHTVRRHYLKEAILTEKVGGGEKLIHGEKKFTHGERREKFRG
jgi:hypothetical protein